MFLGDADAEGGRGQLGDGAAEGAQVSFGADAREGNVRDVSALGAIDAREIHEVLVAFDADEEAAGVVGIVEPAEALEVEFDGAGLREARKIFSQLVEFLVGELAEEAGGDVEIRGRAPCEGGERTQVLEEELQIAADGVIEREAGEKTHKVRS
jgi:hypothetical protein